MTTLLIDLETLPEDATVGMDLDHPPGWEPEPHPGFDREVPRNWKDYAKIAAWHVTENARQVEELNGWGDKQIEAGRKWFASASLDPMRLRIACIGWGIVGEDPQVIECFEDEATGLGDLLRVVEARKPTKIVAHNLLGFDAPVLQMRAIKHGLMKIASGLHQDKPWDGYLFDTHLLWPVTKFRGRPTSSTNMNAICAFLGLDRPDNPISGAGVLEAYVDGRQDEIVAHCRADIRDLGKVWDVVRQIRGL